MNGYNLVSNRRSVLASRFVVNDPAKEFHGRRAAH
jgi:hypothetical protein